MPEGSAPPFPSGQVVDGKYRIEKTLGESGLAVTVLATQIELDRTVALKLLQPAARARADLVARFEKDARLAARMKNDHVVRVLDVAVSDDGPYMVMEYLEGKDLGVVAVDEQGPLAVERAVGYAVDACEGLAEAHEMGYLHGDIRPTNLFLARRPGTPILKIISVGISGSAAERGEEGAWADSPGGGAGALAYMAPERLEAGAAVDMRADVWSLGVVLYELLTGARPFQGANAAALCLSIATDAPPPPMTLRPDVPLALQGIVLRCLEKRPEDRYPSVGQLAHELGPFAKTAEPPVVVEGGIALKARREPSSGSIEVKIAPRSVPPDPRRMAKTMVLPGRKRGRSSLAGVLTVAVGCLLAAGLVTWSVHARRAQRAMAHAGSPGTAAPLAVTAPPPAVAPAEPDPPETASVPALSIPIVPASALAEETPPPPAALATTPVRRLVRPAARAAPGPRPPAAVAEPRPPPVATAAPPAPAPTATDPRASFGERQ